MKTRKQLVAITAILLIIITASAAYVYQTDPRIKEYIKLSGIKHQLNTPANAEFLGIKQYKLPNHTITVYHLETEKHAL